jgi:hypothetical protein
VSTAQSTCPLCQRPNRCEASSANGRCWCFDIQVPAGLLAQLPESQRNTACICRECIDGFTAKPGHKKTSPA